MKKSIKKEVFLCFSIIIIGVFVYACSAPSTPKLPDKELFLNFYKEVMSACAPLDNTYRPFADAMGKNRWMEAAQIAKRIKEPMHDGWYNFTLIKVPDLQNVEAKNKLQEGKEALDTSYYHKNKIIEKYLELIKNPDGIIDTGSDIMNSSERVQAAMTNGILSIFSVSIKLGITSEEMTQIRKRS